MKYAVAVDIGGTNTRVALVDEKLVIRERKQFVTDRYEPDVTLKKIEETIGEFGQSLIGIGMSCPGPLDLIEEKILTPPNLKDKWHNFHIAKRLRELVGVPVYLNNDANLAALAEAVVGEGKDYKYVQFLTVSTGIGAGFVIDKKIYLGAHGFANEVANSIMIQNGPQHGTIIPGGVEAICSGTAITERAKRAGLSVNHAGEVNDLAIQGNDTAKQIMEDAKNYLANLIAFIYAFTDPDIVILGGSVALKIEGFIDEVERLVKTKVYSSITPFIHVKKTKLNEDSGLIGAAYLAFTRIE